MSKLNQSVFISRIQSQQGAALILFFMVILLTGVIFVISNVSMDDSRIENEEKTTMALAKAKEALIAYAVTKHYDLTNTTDKPKNGAMGFLPCSVEGNEGVAPGTCTGSQYQSRMGRLPWKTLGLKPLKDGSGNCLWYAVSGDYKDTGRFDRNPLGSLNGNGLARTEMLNDDSNGSFNLEDRSGNVINGTVPSDRAVAVIIAPGGPIAGQVRTNDNSQCGGDNDATQFMEVLNGIDNTSVTATDYFVDTFIAAAKTNDKNFNDRIITVSQQEIFDAIKQQAEFTTLVSNTTEALATCVKDFGQQNSTIPGGTPCPPVCSRTTCRRGCQIQFLFCRFVQGNPQAFCWDEREQCRDNCDLCVSSLPPGCGGGGGGNDYRLPWPAALDLNGADYRFSESYVEDNSIHLGRFPVDVTSTAGAKSIADNFLLEHTYGECANFNTDAVTVGGISYNSAERRFWENWKDHFFYAVAGDFDGNTVPTPASCGDCLNINAPLNANYAAIVFFSGERLNGQTRDTAPDPETKNIIGNYLEGRNATNYPDTTGDGNYETNITTTIFNDIAYCIGTDMSVIECP